MRSSPVPSAEGTIPPRVTTDTDPPPAPADPLPAAPPPAAAAAEPAAQAASGAARQLGAAALRGVALTVVSHGGSQVLRLASNLLLTRLLFPEAFGLMALVNGCMTALQMFSDLGLRAGIISDERGDEPGFLNTAWTLGVIRNTCIWLVSCALAWPVSRFYEQPELLWMLPVVGLQALVMGFTSTNYTTLNRKLILGRITVIELSIQVVSLLAMCACAWVYRSVWALVVGNLVSATLWMACSHLALPGTKNRFAWDAAAARRLVRFGRWIFLSTVLTYLAGHSDRMILGASMTAAALGVYNIAAFLGHAVQDGLSSISGRVLFPLYARLAELDPGSLRGRLRRARAQLLVLALPPVCVLVAFGAEVLRLLYDARYQDGAWVLQVLAAGSIAEIVNLTGSPVLLARGDSFRHMLVLVVRSTLLIASLYLGNRWWGVEGQVLAIAANPLLGYPALAWATRAHGVWLPGLDAAAFAGSALLIGLLELVRRALFV